MSRDVLPINDDPRHQPGAPLTTYEKRTIATLIAVPIATVLLVGPLSSAVLAVVGAVANSHPDAWKDAATGILTLLVVGGILSPLLAGGRR